MPGVIKHYEMLTHWKKTLLNVWMDHQSFYIGDIISKGVDCSKTIVITGRIGENSGSFFYCC